MEKYMYTYSVAEWILIFFLYCFLGWIWECCYVSVRQRHWVNRGYLSGPFLPIYGFGAIIILFLTLPFSDNLAAVFFLGMVGATLLEFVTGFVMEQIFKVKYWDYSNMPLNLKGYVCLPATLCWGVFSVLLVRYIHSPIDELVRQISEKLLPVIDGILLVYFVTDVICSTQEALDLRKIIQVYILENPELQNLKLNVEEGLEQSRQKLEESLELSKQKFEESLEQSRQKLGESLEQSFQRLEEGFAKSCQKLEEGLEQSKQKFAESKQYVEQSRLQFEDSKHKIKMYGESKKRAMRMLKRNHIRINKDIKLSFEEIKEFLERM